MQNPKCPLPIGMENTKFLNHSILSQEVDRVIGKRFRNEQCLPQSFLQIQYVAEQGWIITHV